MFCLARYLFQCSLDLYSLRPGHSGVGQAVAVVSPPGEVDALFMQVSESLCHHLHGVVSQRRCVLQQDNGKILLSLDRHGNRSIFPLSLFYSGALSSSSSMQS